MKRIIGLALAVGLIATACGDGDAGQIKTCDGVADATIVLVQDVIDAIEAMTPEDVTALAQGKEFEVFVEIEERGTELGTKAEELECEDIDALVAERADQLVGDPTNSFSQLIISGTKEGQDVMSRLFR